MATLKFDYILQEFSERIGNRLDAAFTPGAGAFPDGNLLDKEDAIAIVNKALHKYHNDAWTAVKGDKEAFIKIFPELVRLTAAVTFTTGIYTVATPYLDFFALISGYKSATIPFRIEPEENLYLLQTNSYPRHAPTAAKPMVVPFASKVYVFPNSETTGSLHYIAQPLIPPTGGFLEQNGSLGDSPFYNTRNTAIAAVAEELYWNEKKADRS
jgi:hypothetical protein